MWSVLRDWAGMGDHALSARDRIIIYEIQAARVVLGMLVGGCPCRLGRGSLQGLFRNPLARSGASSACRRGAGLGAISVIVLRRNCTCAGHRPLRHLRAAFDGGLSRRARLDAHPLRVATRAGRTSVRTMLSGRHSRSAPWQARFFRSHGLRRRRTSNCRDLTFWGLGSLAGAPGPRSCPPVPIIAIALLAAPFISARLNALALGEASAVSEASRVQRLRRSLFLTVAAATGAAVAVSGDRIGFDSGIVDAASAGLSDRSRSFAICCRLQRCLAAALFVLADSVTAAPSSRRRSFPSASSPPAVGAPFFLWILPAAPRHSRL